MIVNRIVAMLESVFGGARPGKSIVVGGIDMSRRPVPEVVRRLGMDPQAFLSMGHG